MLELPHDTIVILLSNAFRITDSAFDKGLKTSFEELINLVVIVVIVPYSEHTLDVVPYCSSETRCIDLTMRTHRVVRQIVSRLELVVEEIAHIVVKSIHQRVTVIIPGIVLHAEGRYVVQLTSLKIEEKALKGSRDLHTLYLIIDSMRL